MAPTEAVETLIFVDVDGVLNVGIHDEGKAPLLLRDEDVQTAIKLAKRGYKGPEASCVEKLSTLATSQVGFNENDTYEPWPGLAPKEKLMTRQGAEVADILVERLAKVISLAGDCKALHNDCEGVPVSKIEEEAEEGMSPAMRQDLANLGICFMATVFAYYGLSYSADSLSSNPFISATLISGSDVLACLFASCASRWGLLRAQLGGFLAAALSLLACALGTVDSPFTISVAIVARMALSVVFVTIYVALAQIFPERYQKTALPTCEIMARAGGCLSPSCGTLPAHISLPIFGFACLVATRATMKLPDKPSIKER
eukprot:g1707.t1